MSTTTTDTPAPRRPKRELPPLMQLTEAAAERLRSLYAAGDEGKLLIPVDEPERYFGPTVVPPGLEKCESTPDISTRPLV